jgi:hypothetical protein
MTAWLRPANGFGSPHRSTAIDAGIRLGYTLGRWAASGSEPPLMTGPFMVARHTSVRSRLASLLAVAATAGMLAACGATVRPVSNDEYFTEPGANVSNHDGLAGPDGLTLLGGKSDKSAGQDTGGGLGVNAYLWRGTLDTLSFMPLASADPFGGVIITDWYSPPSANGERFKATAYILGRQLRADGVRISIFRQVEQNGRWVDAPVAPSTTGEIENKVLARARELRAQSASAN